MSHCSVCTKNRSDVLQHFPVKPIVPLIFRSLYSKSRRFFFCTPGRTN